MNTKLRILTYHHIPNNGAFLFANSLAEILRTNLPGWDVRFIDFKTTRLALYEFLKLLKLNSREPLYYYKRYRLWMDFLKVHLDLDHSHPAASGEKGVQRYYSKNSDALLVGMDVWCIGRGTQRPGFPNIYWLPEKMNIPKLAYGVSGYYSDNRLIKENAGIITRYLNDFDVIGSRDRFTHEMVIKYRTRKTGFIGRVPDPTLFVDTPPTGIKEKARSLGIDPDRPVLGLLLYDNDRLSESLCTHFRTRGYQVAALSMYNPHADINLGHVLNPFQWAEFFGLLTFCVTDRFHGTIHCIKDRVPFLSLETEPIPRAQSKLFDLLMDFGLTFCYEDLKEDGMSIQNVLSHIQEIENSWEKSLKPLIAPACKKLEFDHREFVQGMRNHLYLQT